MSRICDKLLGILSFVKAIVGEVKSSTRRRAAGSTERRVRRTKSVILFQFFDYIAVEILRIIQFNQAESRCFIRVAGVQGGDDRFFACFGQDHFHAPFGQAAEFAVFADMRIAARLRQKLSFAAHLPCAMGVVADCAGTSGE